jgi:hypothetical protein
MKKFLWKLLLFQSIFYVLLYLIGYLENNLNPLGRIVYKALVIFGYSISILVTFIIPMIKLHKNETYGGNN